MPEPKNCDCLNESEKNIIKFIKDKFEHENKRVVSYNEQESGYVNKVLSFSDNSGWELVMPFELSYTPLKSNGTRGNEKKYKTSISPAYCPFCGKKQSS